MGTETQVDYMRKQLAVPDNRYKNLKSFLNGISVSTDVDDTYDYYFMNVPRTELVRFHRNLKKMELSKRLDDRVVDRIFGLLGISREVTFEQICDIGWKQ